MGLAMRRAVASTEPFLAFTSIEVEVGLARNGGRNRSGTERLRALRLGRPRAPTPVIPARNDRREKCSVTGANERDNPCS